MILLSPCLRLRMRPRSRLLPNHGNLHCDARHGTKCFTSIYLPKGVGHPLDDPADRAPPTASPLWAPRKFRSEPRPPLRVFIKEGFSFVYQDVRARGQSEATSSTHDAPHTR